MLVQCRLSVYCKLPNRFSVGTPLREVHSPIRFSLRSISLNLCLLLCTWNVLRINHSILFPRISGKYKITWPKVCDQLAITNTPNFFFVEMWLSVIEAKYVGCTHSWATWRHVSLVSSKYRLCCIMIIFHTFLLGSESLWWYAVAAISES